MAEKNLRIAYTFILKDGTEKRFDLALDPARLSIILPECEQPEWTRLGYFQCENCPLDPAVTHCPVAVNLSSLVKEFERAFSYEVASVRVETADRTFSRETTIQRALSSLVGIYMSASECPVMMYLRPMVRFHLPFAVPEETTYRAVTMYLMAQYFLMKAGKTPDWDLKGLADIYRGISKVNKGISQRVSNASIHDANSNAVVILHSIGETVPFMIENGLDELQPLFHMYLNEPPSHTNDAANQ